MTEIERVELRAERLRVLVAAIGAEPSVDAEIDASDAREYLKGLEYEHVARDLDLACELANLARELRTRQWAALERLGGLLAAGEGNTLNEKFASLPTAEMIEASRCMLDCWGHHPPAEDEFHGYVAEEE